MPQAPLPNIYFVVLSVLVLISLVMMHGLTREIKQERLAFLELLNGRETQLAGLKSELKGLVQNVQKSDANVAEINQRLSENQTQVRSLTDELKGLSQSVKKNISDVEGLVNGQNLLKVAIGEVKAANNSLTEKYISLDQKSQTTQ